MTNHPDPRVLLAETFGPSGPGREPALVSAPGRVNLIGEHIDYHGLAVLPMAMRRSVRVAFRARADHLIRAVSAGGYGVREFAWTADLAPTGGGDWENYLRAAACAVDRKWGTGRGVDAAIVSDLPPAAGLSSSSALLVAFTLSLLGANGAAPTFEELMEVLPEGEQFVGTRGGGMDHAASLASQAGCASLIEFDPLAVRPVPVPRGLGIPGGPQPHRRGEIRGRQAAVQRLPRGRHNGFAAPGIFLVPAGDRGAHAGGTGRIGRAEVNQRRGARRIPARDERSPARPRRRSRDGTARRGRLRIAAGCTRMPACATVCT